MVVKKFSLIFVVIFSFFSIAHAELVSFSRDLQKWSSGDNIPGFPRGYPGDKLTLTDPLSGISQQVEWKNDELGRFDRILSWYPQSVLVKNSNHLFAALLDLKNGQILSKINYPQAHYGNDTRDFDASIKLDSDARRICFFSNSRVGVFNLPDQRWETNIESKGKKYFESSAGNVKKIIPVHSEGDVVTFGYFPDSTSDEQSYDIFEMDCTKPDRAIKKISLQGLQTEQNKIQGNYFHLDYQVLPIDSTSWIISKSIFVPLINKTQSQLVRMTKKNGQYSVVGKAAIEGFYNIKLLAFDGVKNVVIVLGKWIFPERKNKNVILDLETFQARVGAEYPVQPKGFKYSIYDGSLFVMPNMVYRSSSGKFEILPILR
jgi:hypothetical protein